MTPDLDDLRGDPTRVHEALIELYGELRELRSTVSQHDRETTSIHADLRDLAELVGVHYDGRSSPAGFLRHDIMPAIHRRLHARDPREDYTDRRLAETPGNRRCPVRPNLLRHTHDDWYEPKLRYLWETHTDREIPFDQWVEELA